MHEDDIRPNPRNFWGIVIFIFGLSLYAFAAAAVGDLLVELHLAVQMTWYLIAGIAWFWPAKYLFRWMAAWHLKDKKD